MTLTAADGTTPFNGDVTCISGGSESPLPFTNGQAQFALVHGNSITLKDLPVGTVWTVTEDTTGMAADQWQTLVNGAAAASSSGTVRAAGDTFTAAFTNRYIKGVTPTSVELPGFAVSKTFDAWNLDVCANETFPSDSHRQRQRPHARRDGASLTLSSTSHSGSFGGINFTEAGTYTYTVTETRGTNANITYDNTVYTVTVTVGKKDTPTSPRSRASPIPPTA